MADRTAGAYKRNQRATGIVTPAKVQPQGSIAYSSSGHSLPTFIASASFYPVGARHALTGRRGQALDGALTCCRADRDDRGLGEALHAVPAIPAEFACGNSWFLVRCTNRASVGRVSMGAPAKGPCSRAASFPETVYSTVYWPIRVRVLEVTTFGRAVGLDTQPPQTRGADTLAPAVGAERRIRTAPIALQPKLVLRDRSGHAISARPKKRWEWARTARQDSAAVPRRIERRV